MALYIAIRFWPPAETSKPQVTSIERLPQFELPDMYGERRSIDEWRGKIVLLNFWATWCAPCRKEMPLLQQLDDDAADIDFEVVGIAIDRLPDVIAFVSETGIRYPILVGQQDALDVTDQFGLDLLGLPFSVLADRDGRLLRSYIGELKADDLELILSVVGELAGGGIDADEARRVLAGS